LSAAGPGMSLLRSESATGTVSSAGPRHSEPVKLSSGGAEPELSPKTVEDEAAEGDPSREFDDTGDAAAAEEEDTDGVPGDDAEEDDEAAGEGEAEYASGENDGMDTPADDEDDEDDVGDKIGGDIDDEEDLALEMSVVDGDADEDLGARSVDTAPREGISSDVDIVPADGVIESSGDLGVPADAGDMGDMYFGQFEAHKIDGQWVVINSTMHDLVEFPFDSNRSANAVGLEAFARHASPRVAVVHGRHGPRRFVGKARRNLLRRR